MPVGCRVAFAANTPAGPATHNQRRTPAPSVSTEAVPIEALLRDAAAFEADTNIPEGLAYRALARQIETQRIKARRKERRFGNAPALLGGLSLGTLAGAAAAVVICLHTNSLPVATTAIQPSEMAVSEQPSKAQAQSRKTTVSAPTANSPNREQEHPVKSDTPAPQERHSEPVHSASPARVAEAEDAHPIRHTQPVEQSHPREVHTAQTTEEKPAVVHWQSETVDQTAYQLVSNGYAATPAGDGSGDAVLTPVEYQAGIDPVSQDSSASNSNQH